MIPHQLEGIRETLIRADENIRNLQAEAKRFFEECKYPSLPKLNDKAAVLDAVSYYRELKIPLRFSILSGEIVHHFRSALDHLVWQLSVPAYRTSKHERFIEFPILKTRPLPEHKFSQFKRKVGGIKSVRALKLIYSIQPYRASNPEREALWVIHDLDRTYKHREVVIVTNQATALFRSPELATRFAGYMKGDVTFTPAMKDEFDQNAKVLPTIAFTKMSWGQVEPVVPLLANLSDFTKQVIAAFAEEFV